MRLAGDLEFGKSYNFNRDSEIDHTMPESQGNATVLEYRSKIARAEQKPTELHDFLHGKYSWASLKVRICYDGGTVDEENEDTTSISAWRWVLELSDGSIASPFDDELSSFPKPLYPTDEEDLHAGACRTGYIIFAVPDGQRVTRVLYAREGYLPVAWTDR
ncbi:hypothetical protein ABZ402_29730 [Streptomyces mirabilis]|uniref:hypothetical protein n=1 Tax=Streptomyces mirabilis TaxID=68239 RepID=UPI0034070141